MTTLQQIRARHKCVDADFPTLAPIDGAEAHRHRAFLLAEVDRLTSALKELDYERNQEVSALKALCGAAAEIVPARYYPSLHTDLKEAAK